MTSALARVSKEWLQICTFKRSIFAQTFSSLSRQRCFSIQIRQHTKIREFWQLLSSLFLEKETPHVGSSWTKESPASFRVLQTSSCPCHTPITTTLLRQDLAPSQKVNIPGAFCMQEIQQQWQCELRPRPGPEPLPWQSAAPPLVSPAETWQL